MQASPKKMNTHLGSSWNPHFHPIGITISSWFYLWTYMENGGFTRVFHPRLGPVIPWLSTSSTCFFLLAFVSFPSAVVPHLKRCFDRDSPGIVMEQWEKIPDNGWEWYDHFWSWYLFMGCHGDLTAVLMLTWCLNRDGHGIRMDCRTTWG